MNKKKIILLLAISGLIGSYFYFGGQQYLTANFFSELQRDEPMLTRIIFFLTYVVVTGLSLPGAAVLTIISGAIFGFADGLLLASFASSIGATLAFLCSRTLFKQYIENKFFVYLRTVNQGLQKDGVLYLATLRLVPVVPFFVINLILGLTSMKVTTFYWVSQLCMLPGTAVYVNAGVQLGRLDELSLTGILSPSIIGSLILLGVFPWLALWVVNRFKMYRIYSKFQRPKFFDNNLSVIGAGSAGLVSSYLAATLNARVSLIEKHKMGGDCLNTGCVPSKALLRSAKIANYINGSAKYGIVCSTVEINFATVMERIEAIIKKIEPHDSVERYTGLGVNCITGTARIVNPWTVEVDGNRITSRNIIIASGASPRIPILPGLDQVEYRTSDDIWQIREKPESMLVIGGGPVGCELAQAFNRLQVKITLLDVGSLLLSREDEDVSQAILHQFLSEGVDLLLNHRSISFHKVNTKGTSKPRQWLVAESNGQQVEIDFDIVLFATGREANTSNMGLEKLGIEFAQNGQIKVNEYLQTQYPNIYACGDVTGPYQFTHVAAHQAWHCVVNALFGRIRKFKVNYSIIPWCTFLDPEVARVGLNEQEAIKKGVDYEVTKFNIKDLDRAIADEEAKGFVKILTAPGKDRILGVTIVGHHAGELITEYITAMRYNLGLNQILKTIHIYPTYSEANKYAAGQWKKNHAPQKILSYLEKWHTWIRS